MAAGDNPERLTSEAAFAHLCGVAPLEASAGKTRRHRLNRGGNRQANNALYSIVITRMRSHHLSTTLGSSPARAVTYQEPAPTNGWPISVLSSPHPPFDNTGASLGADPSSSASEPLSRSELLVVAGRGGG
jgi:hypothetical protein